MNKTITIVGVYARDWAVVSAQTSADDLFDLMCGWVVGRLIREDDEKVIIAHHWFPEEDQVRHVTTVQKSCIIRRVDFRVKA